MIFGVGEVVICINSGADAPNPWHAANPLTVGAEYTVLKIVESHHADGRRLDDLIAVDKSGRLWSENMFRRRTRDTDISFAYDILRREERSHAWRRLKKRVLNGVEFQWERPR